MQTLAAWIFALMLLAQPKAPWLASYGATSAGIAQAVTEAEPLFQGPLGRQKTAALLVSWMWFESAFRVDAIGDHSMSFGLGQIQASNFGEGVTKEAMLSEPGTAARAVLRLLRVSMKACRTLPLEYRGAWYASGSCEGGRLKSAHRFRKAAWLVGRLPPPGDDSRLTTSEAATSSSP